MNHSPKTYDTLVALARTFRCVCDERLSLLEEERDWRGDDESRDMVEHYSNLRLRCEEALAMAEGRRG